MTDTINSTRLSWGERRALGVEFDKLCELVHESLSGMTDEQVNRYEEIETMLAENPLSGYSSEEIDAYNVEHFGNANGRPSREGA